GLRQKIEPQRADLLDQPAPMPRRRVGIGSRQLLRLVVPPALFDLLAGAALAREAKPAIVVRGAGEDEHAAFRAGDLVHHFDDLARLALGVQGLVSTTSWAKIISSWPTRSGSSGDLR